MTEETQLYLELVYIYDNKPLQVQYWEGPATKIVPKYNRLKQLLLDGQKSENMGLHLDLLDKPDTGEE